MHATAFGTHLVGGIGLIVANKGRVAGQDGALANTVIKSVVTVGGLGLTLYSGLLGRKVGSLADAGAEGATEPRPGAPEELAKAQKQLKMLQWALPVVSGVMILLGAQQGEMQRPQNLIGGFFGR